MSDEIFDGEQSARQILSLASSLLKVFSVRELSCFHWFAYIKNLYIRDSTVEFKGHIL